MKEVTRTGSLVLKAITEQKNVVHLKSLLEEEATESGVSEESLPTQPQATEAAPEDSYCTLFASSQHSQHTDANSNTVSSSYFLNSITPSSPKLYCLLYLFILGTFIHLPRILLYS